MVAASRLGYIDIEGNGCELGDIEGNGCGLGDIEGNGC